jgi:hypothetical protein
VWSLWGKAKAVGDAARVSIVADSETLTYPPLLMASVIVIQR